MRMLILYFAASYIFFGWLFEVYNKQRGGSAFPLWLVSPLLFPLFVVGCGIIGMYKFSEWLTGN